jgi:predicted GIY-YIG superfamily endonuclease
MKEAEAGKPLTLYLFHFEPPYRRARHYLGIASTPRLALRFAEHQAGRGARLTRRALEAGCRLYVARLWHEASWAQERRLKAMSHLDQWCPYCQGTLPDEEVRRMPLLVARPRPTTGWTPTGY